MAYFNHAFTKIFLGTGTNATSNTNLDDGFIKTGGLPTSVLSQNVPAYSGNNVFGPGTFGFFDAKTYLSLGDKSGCCPMILASASLLANDKIGPFHGGYQESNKSKVINPKYIQKLYKVDACTPQQSVISVGTTPGTLHDSELSTVNLTFAGAPGDYHPGTYYDVLVFGDVSGSGALVTVIVGTDGTITSIGDAHSSDTGFIVGEPLVFDIFGSTATFTVATILDTNPTDFQGGTTSANCCFQFLCGETYYLRIDIKGSPALRFLNHNAYQTVYAYTGCCSGPTPTPVDSTLVMIDWAKMIVANQYLTNLAAPVVYDQTGAAWYAPGTTVTYDGEMNPVLPTQWWDKYKSPGYISGDCGGLRLFGAYVETKFGNCSFQITDFFEKEPVRLYASMVDYNGDPCVFESICVYNDCLGHQGMGFGEQVVRDLILSESYLQNFFATDIRIREITQGDQILNSVNRNAMYMRYFILHSVPRFNNPSGTFDNDRYLLEIITNVGGIAVLDKFFNDLASCSDCNAVEETTCVDCVITPDPTLRPSLHPKGLLKKHPKTIKAPVTAPVAPVAPVAPAGTTGTTPAAPTAPTV